MPKLTSNAIVMEFESSDDSFYGMGEEEEDENGQLFSRHVRSAVGTDEGCFIGSNNKGRATISVILSKAQSGKFKGADATLLIFDFTFDAPEKRHRFKHACIDITFESLASRRAPELKQWCPDHVLGDDSSTVYSRSNSSSLSVGKDSLGSLNLGITKTIERQGVTRFEWMANPKGNAKTGKYDGVSWRLNENENNKQGIPHKITVALVVRNYGNFTARLWSEAKLAAAFNPTYWKSLNTKNQAITIDTTQDVGEKISGLEAIEKISLGDLVELPQFI